MSMQKHVLFNFASLSLKAKLRLLTVLFTLILTTIIGYTITSLDKQKSDGLVINIAGRQRMLTQKFTKEFLLAMDLHTRRRVSLTSLPAAKHSSCLILPRKPTKT